MAIGNMYAGGKTLDIFDVDETSSVAYKDSPYIVFSHAFKDLRLTLGYQKNLAFYSKIVDCSEDLSIVDAHNNDGIIAGIDGVIIKSEKHPVTLMLDYYGGYQATLAAGFYQPITKEISWGYSYYKVMRDQLPNSGAELPSQHWLSVSYTFPLF